MKKIWKCVSFVASFVLCLFYFIVAFRLWGVFRELQIMQNLTVSFDLTRNDRYLSLMARYDINEAQLQNFSNSMTFTITPDGVDCLSLSNRSRFLGDITPSIFVIVKSRLYETSQREAIRNTYGQFFKRKLIFAIGTPTINDDQDGLRLESSIHKDILQADFVDTYYNLSYKSLAVLRWINNSCPHEQYYVQADSDALLFPENLRLFAEKNKNKKRHIFGLCWHQAPVRRQGKWRVPETRYSFKYYPDYCSGAAFIMTGDVPKLLLENLNRSSSYMSIDDAYFSGVLAEKSGINRSSRAVGSQLRVRSRISSIRHQRTSCLNEVPQRPVNKEEPQRAVNSRCYDQPTNTNSNAERRRQEAGRKIATRRPVNKGESQRRSVMLKTAREQSMNVVSVMRKDHTGRKLFVMRHGERLDRVFPGWMQLGWTENGRYKPYDLNMPMSLPSRTNYYDFTNDGPLTEVGYITSQMCGRAMRMSRQTVDQIYSSPALRCLQSAHGLLKVARKDASCQINVEPGLFEWLQWYKDDMPTWMTGDECAAYGYEVNRDYKPIMTTEQLKSAAASESIEAYYKRSNDIMKAILEKQS